MVLVVLVVTAMASSGCSYAFQATGGPRNARIDRSTCSTSQRLPVADLAIVGAEVVAATVGIFLHQGVILERREEAGTVLSGTTLFAAILQGASAGEGFRRAEECRGARDIATTALANQ